jgi:hypothetical protein
MLSWWKRHENEVPYRLTKSQRARIEYLTGCVPSLLQAFLACRVEHISIPNSDGDDITVDCDEWRAVRQNVVAFAEDKRRWVSPYDFEM